MTDSRIQWTDVTWNPVRGCTRVSAGCEHCYAERQAHRFSGPGGTYEGLTVLGKHGPRWTGKLRTVPELLDAPLRWRKPRRVFVNSMSDVFHEDVPFEFVDQMFAKMADAGRHTFQILTKRPERMLEYVSGETPRDTARRVFDLTRGEAGKYWPLENVWLGTSVENQATADERIPLLLQTPAAVRFLSVEPLLEAVDLRTAPHPWRHPKAEWVKLDVFGSRRLHWVIVGGESGPGARVCHVDWIRSILAQCKAASFPVFVKQVGSKPTRHGPNVIWWQPKDRKGGDPSEWPEDLRVREFPA